MAAHGHYCTEQMSSTGLLRSREIYLALALWLLASGAAYAQLVERVVDGDTIRVQGVGPVRLIGVDTPEVVDPRRAVQPFGREASAFVRRLVEGQVVRLEYDWQRTDKYRRTLAYVYLPDGTLLNAEIIRQGYGFAYTQYPFKLLDEFRALEREAREASRGLWGLPAEPAAPVIPPDQIMVWVNTRSRVYHCPETQYYGKTKAGSFMSQREATERGYRAAYGRSCQ
jgi:micrococcal nuclease